MNEKKLLRAWNEIDGELVEEAFAEERKTKGRLWTRIRRSRALQTAAAVSAGLLLTAAVSVPIVLWRDGGAVPPGLTVDGTNGEGLLSVPLAAEKDMAVVGTGLIYGEPDEVGIEGAATGDQIQHPRLTGGIIVMAEVEQVLPSEYRLYDGRTCRVAVLRVTEVIRGEEIPEKIWLQYPYYGADIFDGYDRLLFSLDQVGIENYLLVNQIDQEYAYFPHMFKIHETDDIGEGCVIAFRDGEVDQRFFENANQSLRYGMSLPQWESWSEEEVRNWILSKIEGTSGPRYITAADVFTTEEAREAARALAPDAEGAYAHTTDQRSVDGVSRAFVYYRRMIGGFEAEETVRIMDGTVTYSGIRYTEEDLSAVPDLSSALAELDLSVVKPTHLIAEREERAAAGFFEVSDLFREWGELFAGTVNGYYRKTEDGVCGVLCIRLYYEEAGEDAYMSNWYYDTIHYLYAPDGSGREVEHEELVALFGKDIACSHGTFPWGFFTAAAV